MNLIAIFQAIFLGRQALAGDFIYCIIEAYFGPDSHSSPAWLEMDTKSSSNNPDHPYNTERRILYAKAPDGVGIAYWTLGAGRPLVYMTGGPWNHIELWQMPDCRRWYEQLAQRRMLVRYDVRGTGMSERNVVDHSLQAQVSDLQAVLSRVGQPV